MHRPKPITPELLAKAKAWSDFKGNTRSIRTDGGNLIVGDIGEIVFQENYPDAKRISDQDQEADFILKGLRIDVKTKETTVIPRPEYEVTIPADQSHFNTDYYYFYYINKTTQTIHPVGWISKADFFRKAKFQTKGTAFNSVDKTKQWTISKDCYTLRIAEINTNQ